MNSWDYPVIFVFGLGVAVFAYWLLVRAAQKKRDPDFECIVCGRKHNGYYPAQWRYCPYCGAPKKLTR